MLSRGPVRFGCLVGQETYRYPLLPQIIMVLSWDAFRRTSWGDKALYAILQADHGRHYNTSYFVCEGASIAQEHVERNTAVKVLQLPHVGGKQSTGSTMQGCLSPGSAVDLRLR